MKYYKVINVCGIGWSGSGAVVDFLRSYNNVFHFNDEIRFIKDPFGLIDLEILIQNNWQPINVNYYLWNFLRNFDKNIFLHKNTLNKFSRNEDVYRVCKEFKDKIIEYEWPGYTFLYDKDKNDYLRFIEIVFKRLNILKKKFNTSIIYIDPNKDLRGTIQEFINNLIFILMEKQSEHYDTVIFDQGLPAYGGKYLDYFIDGKLISVSRDPRDLFYYAKKNSWMPSKVDIFIKWYRTQMDKILLNIDKNKKTFQFIQFEELVYEQEKIEKKIIDFLGLDSSNLMVGEKYFDPMKSKNNIGIWKKNISNKEISVIENSLPEFLIKYSD